MKNFVDIDYLVRNIDKVIIVDARNNFMIEKEGREIYNKSHIKGSFHIGLSEDMVGTIEKHGGRHPLTDDINTFVQKLESFGISNDTQVIVYDPDFMYAGRFWWMCKYIGLTNVKILNANEQEVINSKLIFTDEKTQKVDKKGSINVKINNSMLADINDIRKIINKKESLLLDSRDSQRYSGDVENVDKESGHIQGAVNFPFADIIENGKFKDKDFFEKHFSKLKEYNEIVAYCGSGVSATINILALDEIGIFAKLYVGSWSDYITYEGSLIVKGK